MSTSTKKPSPKKQRQPRSFADNESLACVASPIGPIRTPVVSTLVKEILLDRLEKEIVSKFSFSLSREKKQQGPKYLVGGKLVSREERESKRRRVEPLTNDTKKKEEKLRSPESEKKVTVKKRLLVGTNQCTRALEAAVLGKGMAPSLLVLARDVYPPTILAHIPFLAKQVGTPILLFPGRASMELGSTLGTKKVAIVLFLPSGDVTDATEEIQQCHKDIDSFVEFAKSKVPSY